MNLKNTTIEILNELSENKYITDIIKEKFSEDCDIIYENFCDDIANLVESAKKAEVTEKGAKILEVMQEKEDKFGNRFTAKRIAEEMFVSSRTVSGSLRKLVTDGYVHKIPGEVAYYQLLDKGRNYKHTEE